MIITNLINNHSNGKWMAVIFSFLLFGLAACGGGGGGSDDDSDNSPQEPTEADSNGITMLESGSGSLEVLELIPSEDVGINIQASSEQTLEWGDNNETTAVTADFDVNVSPEKTGEEIHVSMLPLLNSYSADDLDRSEELPGTGVRIYNHSGILVDVDTNDEDGLLTLNSQHVFSFPGLVLPVPEAAVGVGAKWQYELELDEGKVVTEVHLTAMGADSLSVSTESLYSGDNNEPMDYRHTLEAVYDKASLIIRSGISQLETDHTAPVSINGAAINFQATDRIIHTISRVTL